LSALSVQLSAQPFGERAPDVGACERLDVAASFDQPERLGLARGLEQGARVMRRHDRVGLALDDEDGQGC
jgi:hypothetical protein